MKTVSDQRLWRSLRSRAAGMSDCFLLECHRLQYFFFLRCLGARFNDLTRLACTKGTVF